jgi:hypothetical protein
MHSDKVKEFAKFYNTNYDIVTSLEEKITKHGHLNVNIDGSDNAIGKVIETELIGYNMMSLFSLAKIKQVKHESGEKEQLDKKKMPAEEFAEAKSKASTTELAKTDLLEPHSEFHQPKLKL